MALRRFFITSADIEGELVRLGGDLFHHVRDVCRFETGDEFEVLLGDGFARRVRIASVGKRELTARVVDSRRLAPLPGPAVTLALSIPKLPKVDWIIEKSVELGVSHVRPFVSDFSFLRKVSEVSENRLGRWRKLVQAATQQSGRGELMTIHEPTTLDQVLGEFKSTPRALGIFPYEGEAPQRLDVALAKIKGEAPAGVWAFVGSEGGFSPREVDLFARAGLPATSMGERILRCETACVSLVSLIAFETGLLR